MKTRSSQLTRPQFEALAEMLARGGVVASSDWTTGAGRYVTRRTLPLFCGRLDEFSTRWIDHMLIGEVKRAAKRLKRARPGVNKVVYVSDLAAARRAVSSYLRAQLVRWARCIKRGDLCNARRAAELITRWACLIRSPLTKDRQMAANFCNWVEVAQVFNAEKVRDLPGMHDASKGALRCTG